MYVIVLYALLTIVSSLVLLKIFLTKDDSGIKLIPEKNEWFYGHARLNSRLEEGALEFIFNWSKKLKEKIVRIKNTFVNAFIICDFDVMKEIFVDQGQYTSDRHFFLSENVHGVSNPGGLLSTNGKRWHDNRSFVLNLFRHFGLGKASIDERIELESGFLCEELAKHCGKLIDPDHIVENASSNIICSLIFGERYEYTDPQFKFLMERVSYSFKNGNFNLAIFKKLNRYIPFSKKLSAIDKSHADVNEFLNARIEEHRQTFDANNIRDITDAYLLEISKNNSFELKDLRHCARDLFLAGTETTASTMLWAMFFMALYPDIQTKVQKEIDEVVGRDRLPKKSDMSRLSFTLSTLYEIQRLGCIAQGTLGHISNRDLPFGNKKIPKNELIIGNIYAVLHSDKWDKPYVFDAARFINEKGEIYKPEYFIPYGIGPRMCAGSKLAELELRTFFSSLMHQFSFDFSSEINRNNINFNHRYGQITNKPRIHEFVLTKRI